MKRFITRRASVIAAALLLFSGTSSIQGQAQTTAGQRSADNIWQVGEPPASLSPRTDIVGTSATVLLNKEAFDARLAGVPREDDPNAGRGVEMTLPMPDGTFARFSVLESPMLAPELAAAFPQIRTYRAQGIDDPTATGRFGWTDLGFHSIVISTSGTTYVDPYSKGNLDYYIAYSKQPRRPWADVVEDLAEGLPRVLNQFPIANGDTLRTYRLALAATVEYTAEAGGTKAAAMSRMVTTMNRVNGIYERELAVRMEMVANNEEVIFTAEPDGYTNEDGLAMLDQNQTKLDTIIGSASYDIGHVFSTGGGGIATTPSVCSAGVKARGVTGLDDPVGDAFDVDFVAHEIGHQFGGHHTFNAIDAVNCTTSTRSGNHAYEVGSGSTIMAYAGICGTQDLQKHSDDYFTFESLNEITAYITSGGGTCGATSATGNTPPTVADPGDFTIPGNTPFALTADGNDADGDELTYAWDEYDRGFASTSVLSASTDDGERPLFRSYAPTTSPTRTFPGLDYILDYANDPPNTYSCDDGSGGTDTCLTGETLPTTPRTLRFQVTARDNHSGGGAISTAVSNVTIESTVGPFRVTSPNTGVTYAGGSTQTITWEVNGSNLPPVNAANVKISLSTDGGLTFPRVLRASTPNDGSQDVVIPSVATTTARIKVEAVGNIFFDISAVDFTITADSEPPPVLTPPTNFRVTSKIGNSVTFAWDPGPGLPPPNYLLEGGLLPGQTIANLILPNTPASVTLVLPTGSFYLRLYARAGTFVSLPSNEIQVSVNVPEPPRPPSSLLGMVKFSELGLSWTNDFSGSAPTAIVLDVTGTMTASVALPVSEAFSINGVPPGIYTFSVRATNASGSSASSNPVTLTFPGLALPGGCSGAPGIPRSFVVSKAGNTLSVSWLPPLWVPPDGGPAATSYVLIVSGAFNGTVPATVRALSGEVGPGSYTVSVAAVNACGTGPATTPQTVTVP